MLDLPNNTLHMIAFSSSMEISFLVVLSKLALKSIFVKLQDLEKETEFTFFLGLPNDTVQLKRMATLCLIL